jgi:NADH-quinone oxidoreductase subunit G
VCPGCSRGCAIDLWHRKDEWRFKALDAAKNRAIERVTPRDNPHGPWVCNVARDLPKYFERARATQALVKGAPVEPAAALAAAARLVRDAKKGVALVSSNASNEELAAFKAALGSKLAARVKTDRQPAPGEVVQDDFIINADKTANKAGSLALFPEMDDGTSPLPADTDVVLVWGEGFNPARLPPGAHTIYLAGWQAADHASAEVVIPIAIQTERAGTFTNFEGAARAFEACFAPMPGTQPAERVFEALTRREAVPA